MIDLELMKKDKKKQNLQNFGGFCLLGIFPDFLYLLHFCKVKIQRDKF